MRFVVSYRKKILSNCEREKGLKEKKYNAGDFILATLCSLTVICLAVSITVWFRPLYYLDMKLLDIPEGSGYSEEICRRNYDVLIDYNVIGGPSELKFPDMQMSESGRIHFEEVKRIFVFMQIEALAGIAVLAAMYSGRKKKGWMHLTGFVTVAIAVAVLAAILIDWEWAFETMHSLLFDNDYWLFNPKTDPVIKILPDEFFMHCGIMIISLTAAFTAGLEALYRRKKKDGKA